MSLLFTSTALRWRHWLDQDVFQQNLSLLTFWYFPGKTSRLSPPSLLLPQNVVAVWPWLVAIYMSWFEKNYEENWTRFLQYDVCCWFTQHGSRQNGGRVNKGPDHFLRLSILNSDQIGIVEGPNPQCPQLCHEHRTRRHVVGSIISTYRSRSLEGTLPWLHALRGSIARGIQDG